MPAAHLLVRLTPDGGAQWLALGPGGRVLAGPQAGLPTMGAERVDVIVPAQDVVLLRAPRVARTRRQLEQALPFAVEEQLAAPIETLHVAVAHEQAGDQLTVAVVAQARLEAWLAQVRGAGVEPDRMLPESWLLPDEPATLLIDGEHAVLRYAQAGVLAGGVGEVPAWLGVLDADGRRPAKLHVVAAAGAALPGRLAASADAGLPAAPPNAAHATEPSAPAIEREDPGVLLRWFAARLPQAGGLDLLQGPHAARRGREGVRRSWRWAALLAGLALLGVFAHALVERAQLQARRDEQRLEMERLLRGALPGLTRVVDPKAQLSAAFARAGGTQGQGALPLLARIAPLVAGSGRYTLDAIEFRADTLELTLRTLDVAALDSLRESLATLPGLQVEVTGANPGSGGIEGRLRIRSGG